MRGGVVIMTGALLLFGCGRGESRQPAPAPPSEERADERENMVATQLEGRDIVDPRVLAAMRAVPRHRFVPDEHSAAAYEDRPLPIGHQQTLSSPYIVALMSQLAAIEPGQRVLEVGTGSGYQTAVLAELGARVYSIERLEPLGNGARERLGALGYDSVNLRIGDGYAGWPERAPFDVVLLTAAPREIPEPLLDQLRPSGRLIAPVGGIIEELVVVTRTDSGVLRRTVRPAPMPDPENEF